MDTSSESESGRSRAGRTADISKEISTLANTLQDTSRNLSKVDRMLGQYMEHTDDQAEAMALLRENLGESINQLQKQRAPRTNGTLSASVSSPHTSDLEACSGSEGHRLYHNSLPKDSGRRRRSRSSSVRFRNNSLSGEDIHTLHQSLRQLRSEEHQLSQDLDREILRRNRSDVDTRQAMESLTDHLTASQSQDSQVSSRVERRLRELERRMNTEQRSPEKEKRPEQRVSVSDEPRETFGRRQVHHQEREDSMTAMLLKAEREKSKLEQELERARGLLGQSEDSRESLTQQVEDMRSQMLRAKKEITGIQRALLETSQPSAQPHGNHSEREGGGSRLRGPDRSDLEKDLAELRVQLCKTSVLGEVEELKRALDLKELERVQLSRQVQELSSDLAAREQQQLREIQSRGQAGRMETEALLQESTRSREELRTRAQKAVNQWRAKCRKLEKVLEETKAEAQLHSERAWQATREKESSQAQYKALSQQCEAARRELAEILRRLAQREEELHRKDVELSESHQRHLSLQQDVREVREAKETLEEEIQRLKDTRLESLSKYYDPEREKLLAQLREATAGAAKHKEQCVMLRVNLDRMKDECDKQAAELSTKEDAYAVLRRKYKQLKEEMEDKVRSDERRRASESELVKLEVKVLQMKEEQETVLTSMGEELDSACRSLARSGEDKLQAIFQRPGLEKEPHSWLAETKTKLRWLCEEVRERDTREQRLRKQHQQTRDQLATLRRSRDAEHSALLQRLDTQKEQLHSLNTKRKELQEKIRRKDEELRTLQAQILDLETDKKLDATSKSLGLAACSPSFKSRRSDTRSHHKRLTTSDLDDSQSYGDATLTD